MGVTSSSKARVLLEEAEEKGYEVRKTKIAEADVYSRLAIAEAIVYLAEQMRIIAERRPS